MDTYCVQFAICNSIRSLIGISTGNIITITFAKSAECSAALENNEFCTCSLRVTKRVNSSRTQKEYSAIVASSITNQPIKSTFANTVRIARSLWRSLTNALSVHFASRSQNSKKLLRVTI